MSRHAIGDDAPMAPAPRERRPSAPSDERFAGFVQCDRATEAALGQLPAAQAAADAAERRVRAATLLLLCCGTVQLFVPGAWTGAALAIVLVAASLRSFHGARASLHAARERVEASLRGEGCSPQDLGWLTLP